VLMWKHARQLVILVIGGTLLLIGVAMMVLPGPATVVIPLALAILATEFLWARRLLKRVRDQVSRTIGSTRKTDEKPNGSVSTTAESTRENARK
jgi:uncharacterized protein (TIGR02611 family)